VGPLQNQKQTRLRAPCLRPAKPASGKKNNNDRASLMVGGAGLCPAQLQRGTRVCCL